VRFLPSRGNRIGGAGDSVGQALGVMLPGAPRLAVVSVALICLSTLLSMSVWFSASFAIQELTTRWSLEPWDAALLTVSVQVGFVVGAVALTVTSLADRLPAFALMSVSALSAAAVNLMLIWAPDLSSGLSLRFATGVLMAGIYPIALRSVTTWTQPRIRGRAMGFLLGALTIGSAMPHAMLAIGGVDWRAVFVLTSVLTALGGLLILVVRRNGPYEPARAYFRVRDSLAALRNRTVVMATIGYMGHMWELYAMDMDRGFLAFASWCRFHPRRNLARCRHSVRRHWRRRTRLPRWRLGGRPVWQSYGGVDRAMQFRGVLPQLGFQPQLAAVDGGSRCLRMGLHGDRGFCAVLGTNFRSE